MGNMEVSPQQTQEFCAAEQEPRDRLSVPGGPTTPHSSLPHPWMDPYNNFTLTAEQDESIFKTL